MHEFSLMKDLFEKIKHIAQEAQSEHVTKVHVQLGALAHISPEHFKRHFDDMCQNSIAQDAQLVITQGHDLNAPDAQDITLVSIDVAQE